MCQALSLHDEQSRAGSALREGCGPAMFNTLQANSTSMPAPAQEDTRKKDITGM